MRTGAQQLGTRLRPLLLPDDPLRPFHRSLPRPSEIWQCPVPIHLGRPRVLGTLHTRRRRLPLDANLWDYLQLGCIPLLIRGTCTKGAELYACSRVGVGREVEGYASHRVYPRGAGGRKGMAAFVKGYCCGDIPILINIKCKYHESCGSRSSANIRMHDMYTCLLNNPCSPPPSFFSVPLPIFPQSTPFVSRFFRFAVVFVVCHFL